MVQIAGALVARLLPVFCTHSGLFGTGVAKMINYVLNSNYPETYLPVISIVK